VPRAIERGVDLGFEPPAAADIAVIRGDAVLLREMLSNLIDNAIRYAGGGSAVTVTVGAGPACEIAVVDNGPGIPEAERERMLQPFSRGNQIASPGTGLGLTIVEEIARGHGARLSLETAAEGTGLRVVVRFARSGGEPPR
jgi:two-component system sensor histidine kinase TctE